MVVFAPLIRVPTTALAKVPEVVMELVYAAVIVAAVLICACAVIVLRRRGRSRG